MRKAFKYRLYPTRQQERALESMLDTHRHLYNRALGERKTAYETEKRTVKYAEQSAQLKAERLTNPFLAVTNFSSCQATLRRLDKAFQAFFRRVKSGAVGVGDAQRPGYPRFKGYNRFDSVEFPAHGDGCRFDEGTRKVYFQHVGHVKVKLHRATEGVIKTVSFKREADGWHVVLSCDLGSVAVAPSVNPAVGIDLGLKAFLVTDTGEAVQPPKFYRAAQAKLRRSQRAVSRAVKGSKRRRKVVDRLRSVHQHVTNQRRDFHHKTAHQLVNRFGLIACEDLNIRGIARSRLAKSTHDVAWGAFLNILESKAVEAGVQVIRVPPHNTTQMCSRCGCLPEVPKMLKDRVHDCVHCGYRTDRDQNAAQNILAIGVAYANRLGLSRQASGATCSALNSTVGFA